MGKLEGNVFTYAKRLLLKDKIDVMKVGSLVECVYGFFRERKCWPQIHFPVKGVIYTVSEIQTAATNGGKDMGIQLGELVNPPTEHPVTGKKEPVFFWDKRFREIQPPMSLEFISELQSTKTIKELV